MKFVNSKINGFFLLLTFGMVCGILFGALFGVGVALTVIAPGIRNQGLWTMLAKEPIILFYGAWVGALVGIIPGTLYGLSSYCFKKKSDWLFTGGVYGAVPGFIWMIPFGWRGWPFLLICVSYGVLIGFLNQRFPNWWGMRLRAEGIELLRQNS